MEILSDEKINQIENVQYDPKANAEELVMSALRAVAQAQLDDAIRQFVEILAKSKQGSHHGFGYYKISIGDLYQ